jgi:hypothetical protein
MQTYTLSAIGVRDTVYGDLTNAVIRAKRLDGEYQRIGGVTIEDETGSIVAIVDNDVVEYWDEI